VASEANIFLANVPHIYDYAVIKTHYLDRAFINYMVARQPKIILTCRDPFDTIVSFSRRFKVEYIDVLRNITNTIASVHEIVDCQDVMTLSYEERFTDSPETLGELAEFLDIAVDPLKLSEIFAEFSGDNVQALLETRSGKGENAFFPLALHKTQLHPRHLGDRSLGVGSAVLSPEFKQSALQVLATCAVPPYEYGSVAGSVSHWRPSLFSYHEHFDGESEYIVLCDGAGRHVVWGPYVHIHPGIWRATIRLHGVEDSPPLLLRLEVVSKYSVAASTAVVKPGEAAETTLEFDHFDHLDPLEFRIESIPDGRIGKFKFLGVVLQYMGPGAGADYRLAVKD
jgi:hypothetical protein